MILRALGLIFAIVLLSGPLVAQEVVAQDSNSVKDTFTQAPAEEAEMLAGIDLGAWSVFANNASAILEKGTASQFALTRVRAETVIWRDRFLHALDTNAPRLSTVSKQIAAISAPEGEELTNPILITRMMALKTEYARLSLPRILANEAHVHASGLVSEADIQIRQREAKRLTTRSQSPVNVSLWPDVLSTIGEAVSVTTREVTALAKTLAADGRYWTRLAVVLASTLAVLFFVLRIPVWIASLQTRKFGTTDRTDFLIRFSISLGNVILPIMALSLLSVVLIFSGFTGVASGAFLKMMPVAGGLVFIAKWLADWYFPTSERDDGLLGYDQPTRIKARRLVVSLSVVLAILAMTNVLFKIRPTTDLVMQVAGFPFQIVLGVLLWRLGAVMSNSARPGSAALFKKGRIRVFLGRLAQTFAAFGPLASAFGYAAAAQSITGPAILSLALFAFVVVLHRLSYALTSTDPTPDGSEDDAEPKSDSAPSGLLPIAINTGLLALSFPLLALLWGATPASLVDLWERFRAGFSIGGVTISPTTFATFGVVLMLGVLLTGVIKSSLKTSVLPRTSLDLGGRNAIVAGVGYLGLTLSALAAFTFAGIDLSSLAIVAGALSLGIGFGLQNIVQNFVAGIILLIERPVSEGDMIEVGGQMGYVRDISVRSTRIETFDRTDVIVPNADLISNQVINWTRGNLVGRSIIPVGVAYGSDFERVVEILQAAAEAHPMVLLNPPPSVLLVGIGASSFDYEIRAILRDVNFVMVVKSEILKDVAERFAVAGIEMPFPQSDIWLRNPETLHAPREVE